jgi:hypothetical protein
VHRDIKPSNVRLTREAGGERRVVLLDFGLAKSERPGPALTEPLVFLGTPRYSAPEAAAGLTGPEGDVYSLALILLEGLTGFRPAEGATHVLDMRAQGAAYDVLAQIDDRALCQEVRSVLARALRADPAARPTAAEFAEQLRVLGERRQSAPTVVIRAPAPTPAPAARGRVVRRARRALATALLGLGLVAATGGWLAPPTAPRRHDARSLEPGGLAALARPHAAPRAHASADHDGAAGPPAGVRSAAESPGDEPPSPDARAVGLADSSGSVDSDEDGRVAVPAACVDLSLRPPAAASRAAASADRPALECASVDSDCAPACAEYLALAEHGRPTTAVDACALKASCNALAQCESTKDFGRKCEREAAACCNALKAPTRHLAI